VRLGRRRESLPLPPKRMRFMGETDESFVEIGDELAAQLEELAGLRPDSRVLDIGCGYGRLPHGLLRRGFAGRYLGFDILERQIGWCQRNLARSGVEFRHLDLQNDRYNPDGGGSLAELELGGEQFDVIALYSVFTHLWPEDVTAYLKLGSSALAPGGRMLATCFLTDDEWRRLDAAGKAGIRFPFERSPTCRYANEESPLHMVGYEVDWMLEAAASAGLRPALRPQFGRWSGRAADLSGHAGYQDALVLEPASGSEPVPDA
jgi:SAM-dependent methyltransferase